MPEVILESQQTQSKLIQNQEPEVMGSWPGGFRQPHRRTTWTSIRQRAIANKLVFFNEFHNS